MKDNTASKRGFIAETKKFAPLLHNLVSRDIKIKYRRSVLGIAWSVLNPLLMMIVLTTVFKMLLRNQVENFASYYIIGATLWNFVSEATSASLTSVLGASSLIKKVYIPKYIFPLEKCLFSLINLLFSMVAVLLVMLIQGVYPTWTSLLFFVPIIYCLIFACGVSLFLSAATVFFRDIIHLYGVFLTIWMYMTPILYPISILEGHDAIMKIVNLNPMFHYVIYFRDVLMYNTIPGLRENAICAGMAVISLVIGFSVFRKTEGKFILHI